MAGSCQKNEGYTSTKWRRIKKDVTKRKAKEKMSVGSEEDVHRKE